MAVTASAIIEDVRTLSDMDSATSTISDAQIIRSINRAHQHYYSIIVDADEGFFETIHTASVTANSDTLSPPVTTTFKKIELIEHISGSDQAPLLPIGSKREKYNVGGGFGITTTGSGVGDTQYYYYIEGNAVKIAPTAPVALSELEVTYVPQRTRIDSATVVMDIPDDWESVVLHKVIQELDLRLRDGRDNREVLAGYEAQLITALEQRQRQEPRRILDVNFNSFEDFDGIYMG